MLSKIQIDSFCEKYKIKNYTISKDFLLTVEGDVYLGSKDKRHSHNKWKELPVEFEKINGNLTLELYSLKTLKGCPKIVTGSFIIITKELSSLNFCPENIGGDFICKEIKLKSLEGGPKDVKGNYNCSGNNLQSLIGSPKKIQGDFICSHNNLTSLINAPQYIGKDFSCCHNHLNSLIGCPEYIGEDVSCSYNKLTSVEGLPSSIKALYMSHNNVYNLYGFQFSSDIKLNIYNNPMEIIYGLITRQINTYMEKYYPDKVVAFNDYSIIHWEKKAEMKPIICLERLQFFLRIENIKISEQTLMRISKYYEILNTETEYLAYISENFC